MSYKIILLEPRELELKEKKDIVISGKDKFEIRTMVSRTKDGETEIPIAVAHAQMDGYIKHLEQENIKNNEMAKIAAQAIQDIESLFNLPWYIRLFQWNKYKKLWRGNIK